jgi:DNA-directed RNA polymerase subunit H (RpoH/RPB5)
MSNEIALSDFESYEEIRVSILTNILKMCRSRKWILPENINNKIEELKNDMNDDMIYKINIDVSLLELQTYEPFMDLELKKKSFEMDNIIMVKLFFNKITGKSQPIVDFFDTYSKYHKILVVDNMSEKIRQSLLAVNNHCEIFIKDTLKMDLGSLSIGPEYVVLSQEESKQILEDYGIKKKEMQKMFHTDAASLYLYLKKNQIVRILRNSELSTIAVAYRMVK